MKNRLLFGVFFMLQFVAISQENDFPGYHSENLKLEKLTANTFVHVSYFNSEQWGKVGCNGMVVLNEGQAIIFDTPTNDLAAKELLNWLQITLHQKVIAVVATHFHDDCLGGLTVFHESKIPSYGLNHTIQLAKNQGKTPPQLGFDESLELKIGSELVVCHFLGEGHTADNITGYYPADKVMFGGCLIKSEGAGKGNLEDANVVEWSTTVEKVKMEYPEVKVVIPGHGRPDGANLFDYTIKLFKQN